MTQYINNFKNNVIHSLEQVAESGKAWGKQIVTLDRSGEVWGETPEAQLKGRDRVIITYVALAAVGALCLAISIYGCVMHPGAYTYSMVGWFSFITLGTLKEAVLQTLARSKEKKQFGVEKETEETQYSLQELMDGFKQDMDTSISNFLNKLIPRMFLI